MVKRRKKNTRKNRIRKGFSKNRAKARKINASTPYETCTEQLSPFGGLLALIKFFDLVNFHKIFNFAYQPTSREPKLGHYSMMVGILMLLFIGFNRIWHFVYIRLDAMLCGFFNVTRLPAASTFWRYVDNLGINQAKSLLKVMSILRERVWQLCGFQFYQIRINIDTTVKTVYGNQQGARKGHNTKHRPFCALSKKPANIYWANFVKEQPLTEKKPLHLLLIFITICPLASTMFYCEPMVNSCLGKP